MAVSQLPGTEAESCPELIGSIQEGETMSQGEEERR